jgi:hypothetical protein
MRRDAARKKCRDVQLLPIFEITAKCDGDLGIELQRSVMIILCRAGC